MQKIHPQMIPYLPMLYQNKDSVMAPKYDGIEVHGKGFGGTDTYQCIYEGKNFK